MPRNMSFAMTTEQFRNRTKTVTRRKGWDFLKPGDVFTGVEKAMGLKKGETVKKIHAARVKSVRAEPLNAITRADVIKEGFPEMTPEQFVEMLVTKYRCHPDTVFNRIEFEYLD